MRDELMKTKYYECDCGDFDHTLRVSYFEDEPDQIYLEIHLRQKSFFKRLWGALLYALGRRSRYGDFDEFIWSPKVVKDFRGFLKDFLVDHEKHWDNK